MSSRYAQAIDEAEHSPMLGVQGSAVVPEDEVAEVQMAKKAKTSPQKGEEEVEAKADTMELEKGSPEAEAGSGKARRVREFAADARIFAYRKFC